MPVSATACRLRQRKVLDFTFIEEDIDGAHPNTAEITLTDEAGRTALIRGASIGGGNIIINKSMIQRYRFPVNPIHW